MTANELLELNEAIEPETLTQLFPEWTEKQRVAFMALKAVVDSAAPFMDMDVFENLVHVFNDIEMVPFQTEGCLPEHIFFAIEKLKRIYTPVPLSHEVKTYIKYWLTDAGIYFVPEDIDNFPQPEWYDRMVMKAENGPFPLKNEDDFIEIQAYKYLRIKAYINGGYNTTNRS